MGRNIVKVLVIAEDKNYFFRVRDYLSNVCGYTEYDVSWVDDCSKAKQLLYEKTHDVFLVDYNAGACGAFELLDEASKIHSKIPIVFLTDCHNQNTNYEYEINNTFGSAQKSNAKPAIPAVLENTLTYAFTKSNMFDELLQEKEKAVAALESVKDSIFSTDINGKITNMNAVAEKLTGWPANEAAGKNFFDIIELIDERSQKRVENFLDKVFNTKSVVKIPLRTVMISQSKQTYAVEGTASPVFNNANRLIGAVVVIRDVTDNRELQKKINYQAKHDKLTGFSNRYEFENQMLKIINDAKANGTRHALLYIDVDQFKVLNDTCGHFAGDQMLKQIGLLLKNNIRKMDIIARLGGDEFGIIIKNITIKDACIIADKICKSMQKFKFVWDKKLFTIGVSIGVVEINQNVSNFEYILSAADRSCYAAKEKGGGRYHLYCDEDQELSKRHGEMKLLSTIKEALETDKFCLYYQIIIPASIKEQCTWYETLIRMIDDDGNIILPNNFLPAAQRYNVMPAIDKWVIKKFFETYSTSWSKYNDNNDNIRLRFNINISGASLNDDSFLEFIKSQYAKHSIHAEAICFEITETIAVSNLSNANKFVLELKKLGFKFALDDFGSGLTSFEYLKYLPVDYLKIDGSFIKNITKSPIDYEMVSSINRIAHLMNMKTIAEFVENKEIYDCLKEIGVDYAQGYWVEKPVSLCNTPLFKSKGE